MRLTSEQFNTIAKHSPVLRDEASLLRAAVAIIFRESEHGTEFLLMQRAKHPQDPWSGQMSFPGGKLDPEDASPKAAAIREAFEEVGAVLTDDDYVGQLDDLYGLKVDNKYSVHVACFVFKLNREIKLVGNHEVADLVWLPLAYLHTAERAHDYRHPSNTDVIMPAVLIDADKDQILWGLSLRMLSMLHELIGLDLPVLTPAKEQQLKQIEDQNMNSNDLDSITLNVINRGNN